VLSKAGLWIRTHPAFSNYLEPDFKAQSAAFKKTASSLLEYLINFRPIYKLFKG